MAGDRPRSLRIYLRRQKALLRRQQSGERAEAAIEALERQYPRPGSAGDREPPRREG
jgi:hypothetical protein